MPTSGDRKHSRHGIRSTAHKSQNKGPPLALQRNASPRRIRLRRAQCSSQTATVRTRARHNRRSSHKQPPRQSEAFLAGRTGSPDQTRRVRVRWAVATWAMKHSRQTKEQARLAHSSWRRSSTRAGEGSGTADHWSHSFSCLGPRGARRLQGRPAQGRGEDPAGNRHRRG
jgi:hypothetical protein